jgi:hypothetical protein
MSPDKHSSFICFVYSKARESETLDINNRRKPFFRRNGRFLISYSLSFTVLLTLPAGYNNEFLQLGASILAILIGLFLTALVFALDKFYIPPKKKDGDYRLETTENDRTRSIEISVEEIVYENAQEKLWQKQSLYYVKKFNVLVGKNVIVGIWALALICTYVMYYNFFSVSLEDYSFVEITLPSIFLFLKLLLVVAARFFISYFLIEMFYNTVRIISSMVNFMSIRIQR